MTAAPTATVPRVGNPKRVLTAEDEQAIRAALNRRSLAENSVSEAEAGIRNAVLTAHTHGASIRVLADAIGRSTSTITAWKNEAKASGL